MRSPFGAASYQSPPASPLSDAPRSPGSRTASTRRPACEDTLFFEVPVAEAELLAGGSRLPGGDAAKWTSTPQVSYLTSL